MQHSNTILQLKITVDGWPVSQESNL